LVPSRFTVSAGNVIVCAKPAFAIGARLAVAFTVTVTVDVFERPLLSVADNWNVYTPNINPVTFVLRLAADTIFAVFGPLICVQAVETIVAPLLPAAVPVNVTVLTGMIIV